MGNEELYSIFDHPQVDFNAEEFRRIDESFMMYAGKYPDVNYLNSLRETKTRPYHHLNMLQVVAKQMGSLLFNEHCDIKIAGHEAETTIGEDGEPEEVKTNSSVDKDFIESVLENNDFNKNFSKYIQVMLATGGLAVKPYYDYGAKEFKFSWALADTFIPLKSNTNTISEAVIPSHSKEVVGDKTYFYTLLEFHEWVGEVYLIRNELYRSEDEGKLGKNVSLSERYPDLKEYTEYFKFERPSFAYLKPNDFNNIEPQSPLGLGITDNAKTTLMQINDTYDQFHWEIKQGARKVIVSDHFLLTRTDSKGRPIQYFDDETDVFLGLPQGMDDMRYDDITSEIRAEEYIQSINKFISTLEMQVGLSAGTFSFDGKSVKTATEVVSENSQTFRTRSSHLSNVTEFIQELIISLTQLASETYDENGKPFYKGTIPTPEEIEVDFADGIFENQDAKIDYYGKAVAHQFMPTFKAIQEVFQLSEEDALEWWRAIKNEQQGLDPMTRQNEVEQSLFGDLE